MPLVSVIIPNYNHEKYLQQRIESVLNQTCTDFELIILDDCSTDNSREIIEKFRGNHFITDIIYNEKNSGSTFLQWKKGIELAKGKYIWIAESDDFCDAIFLQKCMSVFQKDETLALVYSNSNIIDQTIDPKYVPKSISPANIVLSGKNIISSYLAYENYIPNASSAVFKKENISSGLTDKLKNFRFTGDWFLWFSLLETGNIFFIDEKLNYFRRHQTSVTISNNDNIKTTIEEIYPEINRITKKLNPNLKNKWNIRKHWIKKINAYYQNSQRFKILYFNPFGDCLCLHIALPFYVTFKKIKKLFIK